MRRATSGHLEPWACVDEHRVHQRGLAEGIAPGRNVTVLPGDPTVNRDTNNGNIVLGDGERVRAASAQLGSYLVHGRSWAQAQCCYARAANSAHKLGLEQCARLGLRYTQDWIAASVEDCEMFWPVRAQFCCARGSDFVRLAPAGEIRPRLLG